MSVSTPWATATAASVARKNKTSVIADTGTNIATYSKSKFCIVVCTADGDIYVKDHVYLFGIDGTTVIDLTEVADHAHTGNGDGGSIIDVYTSNPEVIDLLLIKPTDIIKANWNQTITGTASITDSTFLGTSKPYIRLLTGATSGSGATISYLSALNCSFSQKSTFSARGQFETATNLAFHAGVNADDVTAADSNNNKYQAEVCTVTNQNWWLRTANGSATSASDLGIAITANDFSIKMVHDPQAGTPNVLISIDSANAFTKTTNIPISSSNSTGNIQKFSIKNNTAADRPFRYKGSRLSYLTGDTWAYG